MVFFFIRFHRKDNSLLHETVLQGPEASILIKMLIEYDYIFRLFTILVFYIFYIFKKWRQS